MLLLIPGILTTVLRLVDALSHRLRSPLLVVAVGELRATTTRSIALAATGALAVFGSVAVEGAHFDLQRGLDTDAHAFNRRGGSVDRPVRARRTSWRRPPSTRRPPRGGSPRFPACARCAPTAARSSTSATAASWVVAPPRDDPRPLLPSQLLEGDLSNGQRSACAATAGSASRARSSRPAGCTSATPSRCRRRTRCGCGSRRS